MSNYAPSTIRLLATVLGLSLGAATVPAAAMDRGESASATGSPFARDVATTRGSITGVPGNRSSSPTDAAYALRSSAPQTRMMAGAPNLDWSNSASAVDLPATRTTSGSLLASR